MFDEQSEVIQYRCECLFSLRRNAKAGRKIISNQILIFKVMSKKFKALESNLEFHNFENNNTFTGIFVKTIKLGGEKTEAFDVHIFVNVETGEEQFVKSSYTIDKTIDKIREMGENLSDVVIQIIFLGKTEVNGHPFNKFKTGWMTVEEWDADNLIKQENQPEPEKTEEPKPVKPKAAKKSAKK
jgi:hypothetical protein